MRIFSLQVSRSNYHNDMFNDLIRLRVHNLHIQIEVNELHISIKILICNFETMSRVMRYNFKFYQFLL